MRTRESRRRVKGKGERRKRRTGRQNRPLSLHEKDKPKERPVRDRKR